MLFLGFVFWLRSKQPAILQGHETACRVLKIESTLKERRHTITLAFFLKVEWNAVEMCSTQVHGLLRGICWDAIKHDAGQHGTERQWKAAWNSLNASEGAACWSTDNRIPEVSVTEILWCLHEEQITGKLKQQGGTLLIKKTFSNFSVISSLLNHDIALQRIFEFQNKELQILSKSPPRCLGWDVGA